MGQIKVDGGNGRMWVEWYEQNIKPGKPKVCREEWTKRILN